MSVSRIIQKVADTNFGEITLEELDVWRATTTNLTVIRITIRIQEFLKELYHCVTAAIIRTLQITQEVVSEFLRILRSEMSR